MSEPADNLWVDGDAGLVRAGAAAWPFELDLRTTAVTVEIDGAPFRLAPLRWRDKLALARFAGQGPSFVERHFVRLALGDGQRLPAATESRAVLAALALWLNDPDGDAALPLDPRRLATVTRDVCRATGLTPADLDGRDAFEVEALWSVGGASPAAEPDVVFAAAESGGDFTRILVVPDPAPAEQPEAATRNAAPPLAQAVDADADPGAAPSETAPASSPVEPTRVAPPHAPATDPSIAAEKPIRARPVTAAGDARKRFGPFRVIYPAPASAPAPSYVAQPAPAHSLEPAIQPAEPAPTAPAQADGVLLTAQSAQRSIAPQPGSATADVRSIGVTQAPGSHPLLERPSILTRPAAPGTPSPQVAPVAAHAPDADALLDVLSARLQQAAADLGIDVEV